MLRIELKRDRSNKAIRWGPRTIDIDILLFNNQVINNNRLIVPHLRMHERAFVLVPLHELNPKLLINGEDISAVIEKLDCSQIHKIDDTIMIG